MSAGAPAAAVPAAAAPQVNPNLERILEQSKNGFTERRKTGKGWAAKDFGEGIVLDEEQKRKLKTIGKLVDLPLGIQKISGNTPVEKVKTAREKAKYTNQFLMKNSLFATTAEEIGSDEAFNRAMSIQWGTKLVVPEADLKLFAQSDPPFALTASTLLGQVLYSTLQFRRILDRHKSRYGDNLWVEAGTFFYMFFKGLFFHDITYSEAELMHTHLTSGESAQAATNKTRSEGFERAVNDLIEEQRRAHNNNIVQGTTEGGCNEQGPRNNNQGGLGGGNEQGLMGAPIGNNDNQGGRAGGNEQGPRNNQMPIGAPIGILNNNLMNEQHGGAGDDNRNEQVVPTQQVNQGWHGEDFGRPRTQLRVHDNEQVRIQMPPPVANSRNTELVPMGGGALIGNRDNPVHGRPGRPNSQRPPIQPARPMAIEAQTNHGSSKNAFEELKTELQHQKQRVEELRKELEAAKIQAQRENEAARLQIEEGKDALRRVEGRVLELEKEKEASKQHAPQGQTFVARADQIASYHHPVGSSSQVEVTEPHVGDGGKRSGGPLPQEEQPPKKVKQHENNYNQTRGWWNGFVAWCCGMDG